MQGVLSSLKVVEFAGLGPAPFCAMLLADMGADVVRLERPGGAARLGAADVLARGRRIVEVDLKNPHVIEEVLSLIQEADVVVEGFRPGVMERLGLGPEQCFASNAKLVFARMTGWGQSGPLAERAGHDINYIAISGVLNAIGQADGPPEVPLNLIGDFGGGGMMLAMGIVSAVLHARQTGQGQVIDAAMTDGAALLSSMMWGFMRAGTWKDKRGANLLDGAAHFYTTYRCADGKFLSVGAIEPQFYFALINKCGLVGSVLDTPDYRDPELWPTGKKMLAAVFREQPRDHWCELFSELDVCVAPILDWHESVNHPHNQARQTYVELSGTIQPAPAPRFDKTPSTARPFVVENGGLGSVLVSWRSDSRLQ